MLTRSVLYCTVHLQYKTEDMMTTYSMGPFSDLPYFLTFQSGPDTQRLPNSTQYTAKLKVIQL